MWCGVWWVACSDGGLTQMVYGGSSIRRMVVGSVVVPCRRGWWHRGREGGGGGWMVSPGFSDSKVSMGLVLWIF